MLEIIQAILLGMVQGLTEFIPVSSSAHLIIGEYLLNTDFTSLTYDVALHSGTLLALLVYFRRDLTRFAHGTFTSGQERRTMFQIIVASAPVAVAGFFLIDIVETVFRSLWVIVIMLVLVALVMLVADRWRGSRTVENMSFREAFLIGIAQAVALIPGTSRSGSTIVAGSLLGLNNGEAARFSFYLGIPAIAGANLRTLSKAGVLANIGAEWLVYLVGALVAAVIGYAAIGILLWFLRGHSLAFFAWYRIVLALVLSVVLIT
jgi:undecaprenyl-diphosphatase